MEFKELIAKRRSIRKFTERAIPQQVLEQLLEQTLTAPSARNSRSTRLLVVDDPTLIARMATVRDSGSSFMAGASLAIVVLGDTTKTDLWREDCAISATFLQLACVDAGLGSCWVHIGGRPRSKAEPTGEQAADFLRTLLPLPAGCEPLCIVAIGYSDFTPAPLPPADDTERILRIPRIQ
ncbi:MAG: nitroreductase family protein [Alistipes sp.]